jgi:hypothetical protein
MVCQPEVEIEPALELLHGPRPPHRFTAARGGDMKHDKAIAYSLDRNNPRTGMQLGHMGSTTRTGWGILPSGMPRNGNFQIEEIDQRSRVEWPGSFRKWLLKIVVEVDRRSREKL